MINLEEDKLLRVKEVCDLLRVTPITLKRWEKKGILHTIRVNKRMDRRYNQGDIIGILIGSANCNACSAHHVENVNKFCDDHKEMYEKFIKRNN